MLDLIIIVTNCDIVNTNINLIHSQYLYFLLREVLVTCIVDSSSSLDIIITCFTMLVIVLQI